MEEVKRNVSQLTACFLLLYIRYMDIRRIRKDDELNRLCQCQVVEFSRRLSESDAYDYYASQPRAELLVAEDDGAIVATCGFSPAASKDEEDCEIVDFRVADDYVQKGLPIELLNSAVAEASTFGYRTASVELRSERVDLFRQAGFRDTADPQQPDTSWLVKDLCARHFDDDSLRWKVLGRENIVHRPHLDAYKEKVQLPNGKVYDDFYLLHFSPVVCIVAETVDGKLILERQYRHAAGTILTEIPAGILEEGEQPVEAARRELEEETGFGGGEWKMLAVEYAQGGLQDNKMYSFFAQGVSRTSKRHLDTTEDINVYLIDKETVFRMLLNGEICQAPLATALWKYFVLYTDLARRRG